ncbi:MAG: polysaccharide export protein [Planctomycetota bacterium]|nr:MAG: polysaccharide export protein [Planctomycetota bacterium]
MLLLPAPSLPKAPSRLIGFLAGLMLAAGAGCADSSLDPEELPETAPMVSRLSFDYTVGPGDVLRINVFRHPELSSGIYKQTVPGTPVDAAGQIQMPYIGAVPVAGKTVFQVKEDLEQRLLEYLKRPSVDVAVIEFGYHRIYVIGEVRRPGMFVLDRPMSALEALSLSGGFTVDANRNQVALFNGPIAADNLTLFDAEQLDLAGNTQLKPGDLIYVGRRRWAGVSQAARDLVPILQLISLPVGTARDAVLIQDIRRDN